jgi:hypothetical protein
MEQQPSLQQYPSPQPSFEQPPSLISKRILPVGVTRKQFWYWSIVIIAAAGAATLVLVNTLKPEEEQISINKPKTGPVIYNTLPKGYSFTNPPAGQLPAGFPKELMLAKNAQIFHAEDTIDGTGASQKIVDYSAAQPAPEILNLYRTKLPPLGWKMSYSRGQGNSLLLVYSKNGQSLDVIITPTAASSTQVSLDVRTAKQGS